jgi:hypothetical protein
LLRTAQILAGETPIPRALPPRSRQELFRLLAGLGILLAVAALMIAALWRTRSHSGPA